MTIGELIDSLERCKQEAKVFFAFGSCHPTKVGSWRGIYAEPSLGFSSGDYDDTYEAPTVESLLKELKKAIDGREYTGWKGGEYCYGRGDTLHIDNPGNSSNTELIRVEPGEFAVYLHTAREE